MQLFWCFVIMLSGFLAGKEVGKLKEQDRQERVREWRKITDINRGRNYWDEGR
jgi:hypothetical protein